MDDLNPAAKALERYRDAEREYVDATFPFFASDDTPTDERKDHVKTLHAALEQARNAYFETLRAAGWSVPFP
jgi:NAD(P)H-dependent FMN reductase